MGKSMRCPSEDALLAPPREVIVVAFFSLRLHLSDGRTHSIFICSKAVSPKQHSKLGHTIDSLADALAYDEVGLGAAQIILHVLSTSSIWKLPPETNRKEMRTSPGPSVRNLGTHLHLTE